MSLHPISATTALQQLDQFDTVVDARTEDEYQLDRLPLAVNWPTLNNLERIEVGTLYKSNAFEAKKLGAAMAASNIAEAHSATRDGQTTRLETTHLLLAWWQTQRLFVIDFE